MRPELLEAACADAGIALTLNRRDGYDHSYYFISTFMADHVAWHAERLEVIIPGLEPWAQEALGAGVGLAIGALVGLERGFKLRDQKAGTRVAGVRTFALIGLGAGLAGIIAGDQPIAAGTVIVAILGYLAIAYAPRLQAQGRRDQSGRGSGHGCRGLSRRARQRRPRARRGGGAGVHPRAEGRHPRIRRPARRRRISSALARYGIIALAVLPFLPDQPMGPYGAWNPSKLWWVVVLVTGFSFAGYVANRIFGERNGTIATALIGGAYSSTAVTQSLAQRLGSEQGRAARNRPGSRSPARSCTCASLCWWRSSPTASCCRSSCS